ncbi:hypothetical protein V6N13_019982 [Hibiscus sabdariffa]
MFMFHPTAVYLALENGGSCLSSLRLTLVSAFFRSDTLSKPSLQDEFGHALLLMNLIGNKCNGASKIRLREW